MEQGEERVPGEWIRPWEAQGEATTGVDAADGRTWCRLPAAMLYVRQAAQPV